jgi:tetratricopeptide (TPR) repeat protein
MNHGSTLYKLGDYDRAEESYNEAFTVKDKKIKSDAHYNMGNILYKKAEQIQYQDLQGAQEKLKSALQHYIESIELSPDNTDAKWNLQLAYEKIKQLEQLQQQNQQNQQNKDNKNDQNKQNDNNQQQNNEQKEDQQNQQDNKEEQKHNDQQQQQQQQQPEMKESEEQQKDMKKEDARRLLELYADDADSLNKPMKKKTKTKQPEQDGKDAQIQLF